MISPVFTGMRVSARMVKPWVTSKTCPPPARQVPQLVVRARVTRGEREEQREHSHAPHSAA
jgi:hypothetical protein